MWNSSQDNISCLTLRTGAPTPGENIKSKAEKLKTMVGLVIKHKATKNNIDLIMSSATF